MKLPALRHVTLVTRDEDNQQTRDNIKANENFLNQALNDLLEYIAYLETRVTALGG